MRKSLILTLCLLVLSVAVFCGGYGWINQSKDAITIEETVLDGSKAAAEGITVESRVSLGPLFWNTTYAIGSELDFNTEYKFSSKGWDEIQEPSPYVNLYCPTSFGMGGNNIDLEERNNDFPMKPALDVAKRTPDGETREEILLMADYYTYYPVAMDVHTSRHVSVMEKDMQKALSDYFRIPVPKEHKVKVSVTKDKSGANIDVNYDSLSGAMDFYTEYAVIDDDFYLLIIENDDPERTEELPGELSGIHLLPAEEEENGEQLQLNAEKIKLVYPLDSKEVKPLLLRGSLDGEKLLLITEEKGTFMLSVIDESTMRLLQKIELPWTGEDAVSWDIKQGDGFMIVASSERSFYLLTDSMEGTYEIEMKGTLYNYEQEEWYLPIYDMAMDYDGKRLVTAFYQEKRGEVGANKLGSAFEHYRGHSVYLTVYDNNGVVYAGRYDNSSDRLVPANNGGVRSLDWEAPRVTCRP